MSGESEEPNTSQNSQNVDDSEVTLDLAEALELENKLIEDSAAVLGASNDKTCSYIEGYKKRQALYSCLTCIPEAKIDPDKAAGVCLACSYHCHDGHELIELYTKRNFRCDCGNTKFSDFKCAFNEKTEINNLNAYNQNFCGKYCVCHRPYPDPEDPIPDEMIQCIICEDWYHSRHLGIPLPTENFAEMICEGCMTKHDFLLYYDNLTSGKVQTTTEEADVSVESNGDEDGDKQTYCKKPKEKTDKICAKFWQEVGWRKQLCTCDDCLKTYEVEDVAFLLDHEDPVHLYEEKGKEMMQKMEDTFSTEISQMFNSMDRVTQVELIHDYNDFKTNLADFLRKFAENKKIIRTEDVKEFFEGMKARKRQKVEVPYHCR